jgi:hypothetical protein
MPNGTPGDSPLTDILYHRQVVYSERATELIRQIIALADDKTERDLDNRLHSEYRPSSEPDVHALEEELATLLDRLRAEAKDRGFEVE